jgi:hypothetical protein
VVLLASGPINNLAFVRRLPIGVNLREQALAGPLTGRARCLSDVAVVTDAIPRPSWRSRILARRKDVPSLQTCSDHSIDQHARLREQSRGRGTGTRSLPALGPAVIGRSFLFWRGNRYERFVFARR